MKTKIKPAWILWSAAALLAVLYGLSFTRLSTVNQGVKEKRKAVKTALVNPKNQKLIDRIELLNGNGQEGVILTKEGNFWFVSDYNDEAKVPALSKNIENLLSDLITIRNMYKLSDSIKKDNAFGLTDGSEIHIKYYINSSDTISSSSELIFGNQDFSKTHRYFMTGKSIDVYELDNSLDKYLLTQAKNWGDPYLICQEFVKIRHNALDVQTVKISSNEKTKVLNNSSSEDKADIDKLLELRTSQAEIQGTAQKCEMTLEIWYGDTSSVKIMIYGTDSEEEYMVISEYLIYGTNQKYTVNNKISSWTYSKIKEMML